MDQRQCVAPISRHRIRRRRGEWCWPVREHCLARDAPAKPRETTHSEVAARSGAAELGREVFGQLDHVVSALAQRRQGQRNHIQPIIEILAEMAFLHQSSQRAVGAGDDPHIDAEWAGCRPDDRIRAPAAPAAAWVVAAAASRRSRPAAMCLRRPARILPAITSERAGKGSANVAKQLALQQVLRQGGAVDGNKWPAARASSPHESDAPATPCRFRSRLPAECRRRCAPPAAPAPARPAELANFP